jgi:hypothetical protein
MQYFAMFFGTVETVKMVNELAQAVRVEDWLDETVEVGEALL